MGVAEFRKRGADMNDPQVQFVTAAEARRALTKGDIRDEVAFQNDINTLLARLEDMDDLVLQFDGTAEGRTFIEAWQRARIIVDAGVGHEDEPPAPPTPPGP